MRVTAYVRKKILFTAFFFGVAAQTYLERTNK